MNYFLVQPEVPGGLGHQTKFEKGIIKELHIVFDGWRGSHLLSISPVFLVSEKLKDKLEFNYSGIQSFHKLIIDKSVTFKNLQPNIELPSFYWLKIGEKAFKDDFSSTKYKGLYNQLIISENAYCRFEKNELVYCKTTKISEPYTNNLDKKSCIPR